jgi:hypothetical protein
MPDSEFFEDCCDRLPAKAAVVGLAALCTAALAMGMLDGAPQERPGWLAARGAAQAVAGPAALPDPRLCFRGPRGEPVDFPAAQHCR